VNPLAQVVLPVYPIPPHLPYCGTVAPPVVPVPVPVFPEAELVGVVLPVPVPEPDDAALSLLLTKVRAA